MLTLSWLGLFTCGNLPETTLSSFYSLNIVPTSSICSLTPSEKHLKFLNRAFQVLCNLIQIFFPSWECIIPQQESSAPSSFICIQYFLNTFPTLSPWFFLLFSSWNFDSLCSTQINPNPLYILAHVSLPKAFLQPWKHPLFSTYFLHYSFCSIVLPMLL